MKSKPQPRKDSKILIGYLEFTVEIATGSTLCFSAMNVENGGPVNPKDI